MPPPRIATLAREPTLSFGSAIEKDVGGNGVSSAFFGAGIGAWGLLPGSTGAVVTPFSALQVPTAWICVKRLAEDLGKLPRQVRRRLARGFRVDADHPLNWLLRNPNQWQTPFQFWSYVISWFALRGNAYIVVMRGRAGEPQRMIPLGPDRCVPMLAPSGRIYYQANHPIWGETKRFARDTVIHIRSSISYDGYTGISPIAAAQDAFGLGIATQQHGATLFRQGAQMNGVIKHPGKLSPEAKTYMSDALAAKYAGVQNAHRTLILDENMSFEKLTMTNEDAQFLESRRFSVEDIARMFGMPPHKAGDYSRAHFNNLEQSELAYRSDTLLPIGNQLKEECGRVLLWEDEQDRYEIDVDYDELLRTDRKTRYETDEIGIRSGRLTRNEARISDGREPNVPNGDDFIQPLNMGSTSDSIVTQDSKPEPVDEGGDEG